MRPCNPVNRFLRSLKSLTKRRVLKETNIMLSLQNLSCFPYLLTHTMLSIRLILALCYMHVQVAFHIWKFVHCNNIYLPRKRCFLSGHEHRDHTCDKRKNIFLYLFNKLTKENLLSFLFHWSCIHAPSPLVYGELQRTSEGIPISNKRRLTLKLPRSDC